MRLFPRDIRDLRLARISLGLVLVSLPGIAAPPASGQQPPLVYNVENTGAGFAAPVFPDFAHLPIVRPLPDPFVFADGERDTSWEAFERHRNEWLASMEQNEIGEKPDCHDCTITASYLPTNSTQGTLTVNVTRNGNTLTLSAPVNLPAATGGPFPYVIGMGGFGPGAGTGSMPAAMFTGAANVVYNLNSVTVYKGGQQTMHNTDPFYVLYPEFCAGVCNASNGYPNGPNHGQYAAWTWGVSRLIDGIEIASRQTTNPLPLDTTHSAVTGCSYAGKMALWSGATDERIALTISQENGGGGAPSWRVSHEIETQGSVEDADDTDYSWFNGTTMKQFSGANIYKLPTDHHELMAMVAPRALVQTGDSLYYWLGDRSATIDSLATEQIYGQYGIGDRFGFYIDTNHFHCVVPAYQQTAIQPFIDRFMFGKDEATNLAVSRPLANALERGDQPKISPRRWTAWWGTGRPTFPENDTWNNGGGIILPLNQPMNLKTGDTLTSSFAVQMPGTHGDATVTYPFGFAEMDVLCPDRTSYTLTIPEPGQSFTIPAADKGLHLSASGSATNPGCSHGTGKTTGGYFFALGIQNPGAGNPGLSGFTTTDGTAATAQTDPLAVTFQITDSSSRKGGQLAPLTLVNWQNPYSCTPPGCPVTPTIHWTLPASLTAGVPLGADQLSATASVLQISGLDGPGATGLLTSNPVTGTFTFSPAAGTVLGPGRHALSVTFTPDNIGTTFTNFTAATSTVTVDVKAPRNDQGQNQQ